MKKFLTFGILIVVLAGVFVPSVAFGQDFSIGTALLGPGAIGAGLMGGDVVGGLAKIVSQALMGISSLVLILSGLLFDWVMNFTIVDMAKNIGGSSAVGSSITQAWATLRDIANMCFIFVLLYAAFKTMFDANFGNFQTTIKNIIIVALLINFSLFFSKVVIDASNIVAVGFYKSITTSESSLSGSSTVGGSTEFKKSISASYMNMLGVQKLYGSKILSSPELLKEPSKLLVVGIMSSVFMLVTAVVLLIAGIMFIARFIILIFLMILSPLALIAFIIPSLDKRFWDWFHALVDQSFFAPLYFALTWVVFKIGTSLLEVLKTSQPGQTNDMTDIFTKPGGAMALLMNYVLIIGFSIAALIFAKQMASKTAGFKAIS
ncbi:MAG: hypothetical protein AAB595_01360, partial [Patescibacteria group bacterium]